MEILQKISLDFGRNTLPITVFAKQYDKKSRFLSITPLNNGQQYELEAGITARLQLTKADGHTVINDAEITDGNITVELTEQALAAPGVAVAEIGLYKEQALLSSQTFYIKVEAAAYDKAAPESSDEYNALVAALGKVDGAASSATSAATAANSAAQAANTAASGATEAANAANAAAAGAENVNIKAEQTATGATVTVTDRLGVETAVHIDTITAINGWNDVKNAVRLGLGETLFPVGYEFSTEDAATGAVITWVVRGHNHHKAANKKLTYTMTLEAKYVYGNSSGTYHALQFDASEAMYYAVEELPAGTYYFTVANQAWFTADNGKNFQFTLAKPVPSGGQIALNMSYNATLEGKTASTYNSIAAAAPIETVTITEGSQGTNLGTTDGTGNMNYMHRIIFGSNNYAQSAVRQWLNSKETAGNAWTPTNIFDRAPSWLSSRGGLLFGLPTDFLEAVQIAEIPCRTNSVYEVNSLDGTEFTINQTYTLEDKFFLLSRPEIYGDWDSSSYKDGEHLEYYVGLTNAEKKKYDAAGSARYCWLRSPHPGYAGHERLVNTSGVLIISIAYYSYGVAPACIIA